MDVSDMIEKAWPSPKFGPRVRFVCSGPDPAGPRPGDAFRVIVTDEAQRAIIAELSERIGRTLDPGYISFFDSQSRPATAEHEFVQVVHSAAGPVESVLFASASSVAMQGWIRREFGSWVAQHAQ